MLVLVPAGKNAIASSVETNATPKTWITVLGMLGYFWNMLCNGYWSEDDPIQSAW